MKISLDCAAIQLLGARDVIREEGFVRMSRAKQFHPYRLKHDALEGQSDILTGDISFLKSMGNFLGPKI